jgi:aryl-alcohol dehydrogenase-like predicted oxidoreductase
MSFLRWHRKEVSCQQASLAISAALKRMSAVSYTPSGPAEWLVTCRIQATVAKQHRGAIEVKYRRLGNSNLTVSEIAFGSWLTFSDGRQKDNAIDCVHRALDRGITLIDTANVYGRGAAERVLGEALTGINRDSYVLATKLYFPMSSTDRGLSRAQVFKQLDASLERLRVSHIDLYQCHRYDADTPLEETMQALSEAVRSGKVRYIGFSEWPVDRVEAALAMPGVEKFVSSQPQYSLLHRDPEHALIPLCERSGISQIVWSPLAQGVLTGKYIPGGALPSDSRAANEAISGFLNQAWLGPQVLAAVQALRPLAAGAGLTLAQFALAWVLRQPNVASAITGASRPEQVDENAAASGIAVPAEVFESAERIMDHASV